MFDAQDNAPPWVMNIEVLFTDCEMDKTLNPTCITHLPACINFRSALKEVTISPTSPLDLELPL